MGNPIILAGRKRLQITDSKKKKRFEIEKTGEKQKNTYMFIPSV
jgi:hypothetical protein